jgi:hypothetical protein
VEDNFVHYRGSPKTVMEEEEEEEKEEMEDEEGNGEKG